MRVPLSWLKDYVDIELSDKEISDRLTLSGTKVEEIQEPFGDIENVVVGRILNIQKHPDADKLKVCKVDVGSEVLQIVTAAPNIKESQIIPIALVGAKLSGGMSISKGKLRGVESFGMMCSIAELNLSKADFPDADEDGIFILDDTLPLGVDIKDALDLNEKIFDFEITPNRPDCLSVKGIAREIAVATNMPFKDREYSYAQDKQKSSDLAGVEVLNELCPRYVGKVVKDVKVTDSPDWMKKRLENAGVRSINNIVDITNYVLLELGQPMHAFDLDKLTGKKVVVRSAKDGELLQTLDEEKRELDSSMLVIADEKEPVALAGVMGGEATKVSLETKTILLESANFHGPNVRTTAKKLGLRTDSSARFEKGLPVQNAMYAIDMAASLIQNLCIGTICEGVIDVAEPITETQKLEFDDKKINALLGTDIDRKYMLDLFESLGFSFKEDFLIPPFFRQDLETYADLAEEVARFYDYNNIRPSLLSGKESMQGGRTWKQKIELITRQTLSACGLSEAYTYSFMGNKTLDKLRIPEDSELRSAVVITNPLGEDFSLMRTTTIGSMLQSLALNYNRRNESAKLFEISRVYLKSDDEELPEEREVLTCGIYGDGCDFYSLKAVFEELFTILGIKNYEFSPQEENSTFHPGRTADILVNNKVVGVVGQIHPLVVKNFECADETYVASLNIDILAKNAKLVRKAKPLPKFPSIQRDISMILEDAVLVKDIEKVIHKNSKNILEKCKLFDVYKGKQVQEGFKSVAYSLTFRASDRTLTDDEINDTMNKVVAQLEKRLGAELR